MSWYRKWLDAASDNLRLSPPPRREPVSPLKLAADNVMSRIRCLPQCDEDFHCICCGQCGNILCTNCYETKTSAEIDACYRALS